MCNTGRSCEPAPKYVSCGTCKHRELFRRLPSHMAGILRTSMLKVASQAAAVAVAVVVDVLAGAVVVAEAAVVVVAAAAGAGAVV